MTLTSDASWPPGVFGGRTLKSPLRHNPPETQIQRHRQSLEPVLRFTASSSKFRGREFHLSRIPQDFWGYPLHGAPTSPSRTVHVNTHWFESQYASNIGRQTRHRSPSPVLIADASTNPQPSSTQPTGGTDHILCQSRSPVSPGLSELCTCQRVSSAGTVHTLSSLYSRISCDSEWETVSEVPPLFVQLPLLSSIPSAPSVLAHHNEKKTAAERYHCSETNESASASSLSGKLDRTEAEQPSVSALLGAPITNPNPSGSESSSPLSISLKAPTSNGITHPLPLPALIAGGPEEEPVPHHVTIQDPKYDPEGSRPSCDRSASGHRESFGGREPSHRGRLYSAGTYTTRLPSFSSVISTNKAKIIHDKGLLKRLLKRCGPFAEVFLSPHELDALRIPSWERWIRAILQQEVSAYCTSRFFYLGSRGVLWIALGGVLLVVLGTALFFLGKSFKEQVLFYGPNDSLLHFTLSDSTIWEPHKPVYIYFVLKSFHAVFRSYRQSRPGDIFWGESCKGYSTILSLSAIRSQASLPEVDYNQDPKTPVYPCGLMSFAYMNDAFSVTKVDDSVPNSSSPVPLETNVTANPRNLVLFAKPSISAKSPWIDVKLPRFRNWMDPTPGNDIRALAARLAPPVDLTQYTVHLDANVWPAHKWQVQKGISFAQLSAIGTSQYQVALISFFWGVALLLLSLFLYIAMRLKFRRNH